MKKTTVEELEIMEAAEAIEEPGEDTPETLAGIADLKKKLEDLATNNRRSAEENNKKWKEARARKEGLLKEADKAYKKKDIEGFHKIQDEIRLCEDAMKIYMGAISAADNTPIITKEQFNDYFNQICAYISSVIEEDRETIAELCATLIYIRDREAREIVAANKLIEETQKTLLKDPCGMVNDSGVFVEIPSMVKKCQNSKILEFCNFISAHPLISELVEEDNATQGTIKRWV